MQSYAGWMWPPAFIYEWTGVKKQLGGDTSVQWCGVHYTWKQCSNIFCWLSRKKFEHERKFWLVEMVNGPSSSLLPFFILASELQPFWITCWKGRLESKRFLRLQVLRKTSVRGITNLLLTVHYFFSCSHCISFQWILSKLCIKTTFSKIIKPKNKLRENDKLCRTFCRSRSFASKRHSRYGLYVALGPNCYEFMLIIEALKNENGWKCRVKKENFACWRSFLFGPL